MEVRAGVLAEVVTAVFGEVQDRLPPHGFVKGLIARIEALEVSILPEDMLAQLH